jgi:hypothetical protein
MKIEKENKQTRPEEAAEHFHGGAFHSCNPTAIHITAGQRRPRTAGSSGGASSDVRGVRDDFMDGLVTKWESWEIVGN